MNSRYERGYILVRSNDARDISTGIDILLAEVSNNEYNSDDIYYNIGLGLFRTFRNTALKNLINVSDDGRIKRLIDIANMDDMRGLSAQNTALRFFSGGLLLLSAVGLVIR